MSAVLRELAVFTGVLALASISAAYLIAAAPCAC
jgi:hypothetical protein